MKTPVKNYFGLLKKYLKPLWKSVILLALLLMGSVALQLVNPQIVRHFIDEASSSRPINNLVTAAVWYIVIAVLRQLFVVFSTFMCQNVGWSATNALREDLVLHSVNLDMSFHKSRKPGEMIERLDGDVNMMFSFFSKLILEIVNNIALIAGIIILLVREDWRLSAALAVFAVISIVILNRTQAAGIPKWVQERETSARLYGFLGEQLSGLEDIKTSGAAQYSVNNFLKITREVFPYKLKAVLVHFKLWNISTMLSAVSTIIGLGFGGYLWKNGVISIGTVYLIFNYTELINGPLQQLRRNLGDLQKAEASIYRVEELFNMQSAIKDGAQEISEDAALEVKVRNLSFSYSEAAVLKDVSFELKPKRILGIIGRTGSGKTTIARLIARLYEAEKGDVFIEDKNIKDIRLASLRDQIAYVTQEVQLFHATVRDNLAFFNKNIDDETIMKALHDIGLGEWIGSLPNGLDTVLNEGGTVLSSGEAQLLAFVRVFLKNPGLIILDEASSRIDPVTEKYMEKALDKLLSGRTCIMIAHRLSTLERADDILVLDSGRVIEFGERKELLQNEKSRYFGLLREGTEEVLV